MLVAETMKGISEISNGFVNSRMEFANLLMKTYLGTELSPLEWVLFIQPFNVSYRF